MSLIVIHCNDRSVHPRKLEKMHDELRELEQLVKLCGIPEPFKAQLEAVDPLCVGIPHDFVLRIGWEHQCVAATLSGLEWLQMSRDERIGRVHYWVEHSCRELLRAVMADRRECAGKAGAP